MHSSTGEVIWTLYANCINSQICFMLNIGQYWRKKMSGSRSRKIKITGTWKKKFGKRRSRGNSALSIDLRRYQNMIKVFYDHTLPDHFAPFQFLSLA